MSKRACAAAGAVAALLLWRPIAWVLAMAWMLACEVPFIGGQR
jgi:hypothetical protein